MNNDTQAAATRYYLFRYTFPNGHGNYTCTITNGGFPSNKWLTGKMALNAECSVSEVVVSGWNEFKTAHDYHCFCGVF